MIQNRIAGKTCGSIFYLYEEIKKSDRVNSAGRAAYIERNQWMIDSSSICVFCVRSFEEQKSGTICAYQYAQKNVKEMKIINLCEQIQMFNMKL